MGSNSRNRKEAAEMNMGLCAHPANRKEGINMTKIKEQAIEMLRYVPDDKMVYLIDILKGLIGLYSETTVEKAIKSETKAAWDDFRQYYGIVAGPVNEKAELAQARKEKYDANFN
jgi:hypothetical protein